jgi:hypothetical protein
MARVWEGFVTSRIKIFMAAALTAGAYASAPALAQTTMQPLTPTAPKSAQTDAAKTSAPKPAVAKKPAAPKTACVSADEAAAFRLRHLQSRLMVAGLSCGQRDAYNEFVTANKGVLGKYGPQLITYYNRSGGQAALNRYVTDLANAVSSIRAEDPTAFCTHTWNVFWELQEDPALLMDLAAANPVPAVSQPVPCASPAEKPAPQQAKAPVTK